jgi:hypothetical protein
MKKFQSKFTLQIIVLLTVILMTGASVFTEAQIHAQGNSDWLNLDTVKAGKFDTGKMWTFDFPPVD